MISVKTDLTERNSPSFGARISLTKTLARDVTCREAVDFMGLILSHRASR